MIIHNFFGHGFSIGEGFGFCGVFFLAGFVIGRIYRFVPPLFGMVYEPRRGWLYAILVFLYAFINYDLRVFESYFIYNDTLREGVWILIWAFCCAYAIGVGYSGRRIWQSGPSLTHVREWSAGERRVDQERRQKERDES